MLKAQLKVTLNDAKTLKAKADHSLAEENKLLR